MKRIISVLVVAALMAAMLVTMAAAPASANADFCADRNDGAAHFAKDNWDVPYVYRLRGSSLETSRSSATSNR